MLEEPLPPVFHIEESSCNFDAQNMDLDSATAEVSTLEEDEEKELVNRLDESFSSGTSAKMLPMSYSH